MSELDDARYAADQSLDALRALLIGDAATAISIFAVPMTDDARAFGWACGYAALVAKLVTGPEDGRYVAEVDYLPGATIDRPLEELITTVGALVAAIGNDDTPGAYALWKQIPTVEARVHVVFMLAKLAATGLIEARST